MTKSIKPITAVVGLCVFSMLYLVLSATTSTAQEEVREDSQVGRYQISSYGYAGSQGRSSSYGAYIIDSETGTVWVSTKGTAPRKIGAVGK